MKILIVRGAFLNKYEGQNFEPLSKKHEIVGVGSKRPIHSKLAFPVVKFWSPYDVIGRIGMIGGLREIGEKVIKAVCNRVLGDPHYLWGFEKYVRETGPWDIAHIAETYYGYDLQAVCLKHEGHIRKVVSTCWETIPHNNESLSKKKEIKKRVKAAVDLFICPTERAKAALVEEGVEEGKIRVVRVGVDLTRYKISSSKSQAPNKSQIPKSKFQKIAILFVGRLVEEKGIFDLIKALKKVNTQLSTVNNQKRKVKLKIVGSGSLESKIKHLAARDTGYHFELIGTKRYHQMPELYRSADILVAPSKTTATWEEQYGMVLVEAMASGLPIVAYDSGAIGDVVGPACILVPEGDVDALAESIVDLVVDRRRWRILSKIGRRRAARKFDAAKISVKIEELYNKLLAS